MHLFCAHACNDNYFTFKNFFLERYLYELTVFVLDVIEKVPVCEFIDVYNLLNFGGLEICDNPSIR